MALFIAPCAPLSSDPPTGRTADNVHFAAERVSAGVMRLMLENGAPQPVGYNLCTSELQRRDASGWTRVPTDEVCTMQLLTLNPGRDATFEKRLPADLSTGDYRYVTSIESPLGTPQVRIATVPFGG